MTKVDGGELLARTLERAGVDEVFALQGGHLDSFLVACDGHGIRLTDTRHEAAAGHAADGFARSSGKLGVAVVTAGPGFANAFPALVNAWLDAVPTLFIIGAAPLREEETYPLQGGIDQVAMAAPTTKWAYRITHTERIPELIELAIRKATSGKPGPVLIEIPIDVLFAQVESDDVRDANNFYVDNAPAPTLEAVAKVVDILQAAKRPAVMIGGGGFYSGCSEELAKFAELTNIPVTANTKAYGLLPPDHPMNAGNYQSLGAVQMIGQEPPDTLIILGARLGLFSGGRGDAIVPNDARIVQVNLDAGDIGRLRDIEVPIVADVKETLRALNTALDGKSLPDWSEWASAVAQCRAAADFIYADATEEDGKPLHPYLAIKAIAEVCGPDTIYVADGGEASVWASQSVDVHHPGGMLSHGYLGCLGTGQGFAMGAQRAHPDKKVVHITGDGAVGFHIQEFDTMVRHDLPIVTVVLNNHVWGMSYHGQKVVYGENRTVITQLADTNYDEVCIAFGGTGERVETTGEIKAAMERAFASGKPACINISIDPEVIETGTLRMLGMGAESKEDKEKEETVLPYYENLEE